MTFETLNLHPKILSAVANEGYQTPTPIQSQAIPIVQSGSDLIALAQTGTGKTAAFALPILDWLHAHPRPIAIGEVRVLVLVPTRELAAQVGEAFRTYGKNINAHCAVIFGGVDQASQAKALKKGVDVLVATPGRLLDLHDQGLMNLSQLEKLVLDEADRMLDMGFIHDVREVIDLTPEQKQCLLFSATFRDDVQKLARSILKNPQQIQVTPKNTTVELIEQENFSVGRTQKSALLAHLIQSQDWSQVLIFTRTKFTANTLADFLSRHDIPAMAIHGNKSQNLRNQSLNGFREGTIRAMVATDIMARGIDIEALPHVVNFDIPVNPEDYVHRIGRTGRAGIEGVAINFVSRDEEGFMDNIVRFIKKTPKTRLMEGALANFAPHADEHAEPIAMGRQVLWGGRGAPPPPEVMNALAKKARQEMVERIREKKQGRGPSRRVSNVPQPPKKTQTSANFAEERGQTNNRHPFSLRRMKRTHDEDSQLHVLPANELGTGAPSQPPRTGENPHRPSPKRPSRHSTKAPFNGNFTSKKNNAHPRPVENKDETNRGVHHETSWRKNPGVNTRHFSDDSILGTILPPEKKAMSHRPSRPMRSGRSTPARAPGHGFLTRKS